MRVLTGLLAKHHKHTSLGSCNVQLHNELMTGILTILQHDNLDMSINLPERISLTTLGGSSCTKSKVRWDAEEVMLISFPLAPTTAVEFRVSWTAEGTLPSLDAFLSGTTA